MRPSWGLPGNDPLPSRGSWSWPLTTATNRYACWPKTSLPEESRTRCRRAFRKCRTHASRGAGRQLDRLQRLRGRSVNDFAIAREHRPVARTIPRSVGVVPRHGAAFVRAGRGQRVRRAVVILPHGDLLLALLDDAACAGLDVIECIDHRSTVTALVEILGGRARRVVEFPPRVVDFLNLVGDQHRGRRPIA